MIKSIFFDFDGRALCDYPVFVASRDAWRNMSGWTYRLWDEGAVEDLCKATRPEILRIYRSLRYPIQRVDLAKYIIADTPGHEQYTRNMATGASTADQIMLYLEENGYLSDLDYQI